MLGGNSAYSRVVQKLDGCEVGGVDFVEGNRVLLESPFGILGTCGMRQLRGRLCRKVENRQRLETVKNCMKLESCPGATSSVANTISPALAVLKASIDEKEKLGQVGPWT